jgi:SAM-dependent methyltransferase
MSNTDSDSSTSTRSPLIGAILAQVLGAVVSVLLFVFIMPEILAYPVLAGLIQGASASMMSYRLHAPRWWQAIHLAFPPLAVLGHSLALPPMVWLIAFALVLLIFWRTDQSRVPLYLTNATTAGALAQLIPSGPRYVLDIGCGDGGLLRRLARSRPDCEFVGIEHAPLTWLWARVLSSSLSNVHIRLGDFWKQPLAAYDLVYAFLSPTPMPALWLKVREEMRPGCLLVSNSFAVPDQNPLNIIEVADKRQSQLYCYRPGD